MTIHAPLFSVPPCSTQKQVSEGVGQSFSPCTGAQAKQTIVFRCRRGHGNAIVVINRLQVVLDIQLSTHTRTVGTECFLRLVTNPCQCDHVSPVLHQPHWLLVQQHVATLVHKVQSGHAPSNLVDDCCLITDACPKRLRSADTRTLLVSRTRTNFGDRAFSAVGPRVWNYMPNLKTAGLDTQPVWTVADYEFIWAGQSELV